MTEPRAIETGPITEACAAMTALLEKHGTRAFLRREPTAKEIASNALHRDVVRGFLSEILSMGRDAVPAPALAERVVALPRYPGVVLLEKILDAMGPEQRVSLCGSLLASSGDDPRPWPTGCALSALGKMATPAARALLIRCVADQVSVAQSTRELMRSLGFPLVGEARKARHEICEAYSDEGAGRFLDLLGVDPETHAVDLDRARAFRGKVYDDLEGALASPEEVVAIDLRGRKVREVPTELRRCANLRYLVLDDDYLRDAQMRRLEALLPDVEIQWSMSMHIDGKHGR